MTEFIALYRGRTVAEAELIAVTASSSLVRKFFAEMLGEYEQHIEDAGRERPARILEDLRDQ